MAQNFTTVVEHEKVIILPVIGLEIRGRNTLLLLVAIYLPLTFFFILFFRNYINVLLLLLFIEIISLFFTIDYLQKNTRNKTDHISMGRKLYYEYKAYRKVINSEGQVFYLRPTKPQYKLNIRRLK